MSMRTAIQRIINDTEEDAKEAGVSLQDNQLTRNVLRRLKDVLTSTEERDHNIPRIVVDGSHLTEDARSAKERQRLEQDMEDWKRFSKEDGMQYEHKELDDAAVEFYESSGQYAVLCEGGPFDQINYPVSGPVPNGALIPIENQVYKMVIGDGQRKLVWCQKTVDEHNRSIVEGKTL